jgi:hypothetical protein
VKAFRAAGGNGQGSLAIGATGCRDGKTDAGPAGLSAWLQTSPADEFFLLARDVDLSAQLRSAGFADKSIPACPGS